MDHSYPLLTFALGVIAYEFKVGKVNLYLNLETYGGMEYERKSDKKFLAKQVQLDEIPPFGWSR